MIGYRSTEFCEMYTMYFFDSQQKNFIHCT
uniref:Uncharacterized protein n=1 Tax=Anguilla anguilla TaxID=7936 RepID=A0A0E9PRY1_ANGAN